MELVMEEIWQHFTNVTHLFINFLKTFY